MIRVWAVQSYSLNSLRGLMSKYLAKQDDDEGVETNDAHKETRKNRKGSTVSGNVGESGMFGDAQSSGSTGFGALAISPISLLYEWEAHQSPLITGDHSWFIRIIVVLLIFVLNFCL